MRGGVGIVFNNDVENWGLHRRIFKRAVVGMVPHAYGITLKNVKNLIHHWDQLNEKGISLIDLNESTHKLSLDLIGELAFGQELNTVNDLDSSNEMSQIIYKGVNAWMESFIFFFLYPSYWKYLPSPTYKKFKTDLHNLSVLEQKLFREGKSNAKEDTFLKKLSEIEDDETGRKFREEEVLQDIREMLAGGSDTSANTLTYAIYFLCKNPECMEKLVQEVDAIFDEQNLDSIKEMKYLENVLNETMRMIPAGPLIFRKAIRADILQGYQIPKDTNIILNIWHTMTCEKYWKNAKSFDPERFSSDKKIVDHSFVPFGAGLRGCPGKALAMVEMKIILAMLIKYYSFQHHGEDIKPWWGLVEHSGVVLMKVTQRKQDCNDL